METSSVLPTLNFTLKLVDAVTDEIVAGYDDLSATPQINLNGLNLDQFSLVAEVNGAGLDPKAVKSVKLESSLGDRIENTAPYALFGDVNGDFLGQSPQTGTYTLKATAYTQQNGGGQVLGTTNLTYTLFDKGTTEPPTPTPTPDPTPTPKPLPPTTGTLAEQYDKILLFLDGNNNDYDDIAALPIAALWAKAAGIEDKFAIFYNNNLGEPNRSYQLAAMRESAAFAEKIGIDTYDYQANIDGTTNKVAKILNSGEKVLALQGGPMEAIYRALEKTSLKNRSNVTLLTHGKSTFNQNRDLIKLPGITELRTWKDIIADFPEVSLLGIPNQNGSGDGLGDDGFRSSYWNWLDKSSEPLLREARQLMINAEDKVNDASDAGMLFYALTGIEDGDPRDAKVFLERYFSGLSPVPASSPSPEPVAPVPGNGTGLSAVYFDDMNFQDSVLMRTDATVDFDWGTGSPLPEIDDDTFSVRWTGSVLPQYTETYNFSTLTDDGVRLWVNDQLLVDDLTEHTPQKNTGSIDLEAGQLYKIRMDYFENSGGAVSQLSWSSQSQLQEIIPESQLYAYGPGNTSPGTAVE